MSEEIRRAAISLSWDRAVTARQVPLVSGAQFAFSNQTGQFRELVAPIQSGH